ncbi:hypothetical protein G5I_08431 [Acromyrmex echinatior]|uniref:Uncharacterized protein n=1 Tax=Acromyrmex echinatior TaxID=103372 RepID=F4WRH7_ACREC|nr:hypothetical protein G5I_08431 [Acromyrmex echinatior]
MLCNFAWQRVRRCPLDDKVIRAKAEHHAVHGGWRGYEEGCRIPGGVEWVADLPPLASRRMVHRTPVVGALQPVRTKEYIRTIYQETVSRNSCRARQVVTVCNEGDSSRAADSTATGLSDSGSRWSDRLTEGFGGSADGARYPPHRDINALDRTEYTYISIYVAAYVHPR